MILPVVNNMNCSERKGQLLQCLINGRNPDGVIRSEAEKLLGAFSVQPDFGFPFV